jgi:hypothetical protein
MLFPQVPNAIKEKIATEFKLGPSWLAVSHKRESEHGDHLTHQTRAVSNYLTESDNVGTVDSPKSFIQETMELRWFHRNGQVMFIGKTENSIAIIGGSEKHLIGKQDLASVAQEPPYGSDLPSISGFLSRIGETEEPEPAEDTRKWICATALDAEKSIGGVPQRLEFLAKTLLVNSISNATELPYCPVKLPPRAVNVVIASPIYVAMDNLEDGT